MPLVSTILGEPPPSVLPVGGSPRDDAAYLAWRDEFIRVQIDLDVAIRWHEAIDFPGMVIPWCLDWWLFDVLEPPESDSETSTAWSYYHKIRTLAIALKTRPETVRKLAFWYMNNPEFRTIQTRAARTTNALVRARYIVWSRRACSQANQQWRTRTPYQGETLMEPSALDLHLFEWAIETKKLEKPPTPLSRCLLAYVAMVFERWPDEVKDAARAYWGERVAEKGKAS